MEIKKQPVLTPPVEEIVGGKRRKKPAEARNVPSQAAQEHSSPSLPIGVEELEKATERLQRYQRGKANLDQRIISNEEWWKLRHWRELNARFGQKEQEPLEPTSAWLMNCVLNKHADAMDNYPEISVLPRAEDDKGLAEMLTSVVPVVMEENRYEAVYDEAWWYKIKQGASVQGVFWSPGKLGGLGDIEIRTVDLLKLAWEPGVKDIQESDDLFCVDVMTLEQLQERYPGQVDDVAGGLSVTVQEYHHEDVREQTDRVAVIDWYYKKVNSNGRTVLHLCKYVENTVLFASENEEAYRETGWYEHGLYPFVFDAMFPVQDSVVGMGYIDIMRDPQMYIDKIDSLILRNAEQVGRKRHFISDASGVNEKEYADWNRDFVHVQGTLDEAMIREINVSALDAKVYEVRQNKIDELKETSGNRDFSQGGTTSGVTAASAIAALQEAGNKLSRDMIKASYRAYEQVCSMVIELIRQFYTAPRTFRITGKDGKMAFQVVDNSMLHPMELPEEYGVGSMRKPVFDLKVKAQKANPFARVSQNELAIQLYQMGVFNPQMADQALMLLDMMDFEGVESLKEQIAQRGTVFDQMQQQIAMLTQQLTMLTGGMAAPHETAQAQEPQAFAAAGRDPLARAVQSAQHVDGTTAARRTASQGAV